MSANQPTLVVRCAGKKPLRMGPGQRIRIGRHASNDLVLVDDAVSRFHAVIEWDPDEDRPHVADSGSANGVEVDGELIEEKCHLPGGNQIIIGRFLIAVEVTGVDVDGAPGVAAPELNDSDSVVLYTEKREQISGRASSPEELHRVLLDLETRERTGTLTVRIGVVQARLTFCQGLIMTAQCGSTTGHEALREALTASSSIYSFSRELRPVEDPLNISARSYLENELRDLTKKIIMRRGDPPLRGT